MKGPVLQPRFGDITHVKNARIKPPFTWYTIIATWFYVGRLGCAPGTLASIATFPIYYYVLSISYNFEEIQYFFSLLLVSLCLIGWYAVAAFEKITNTHDHSCIVIDEVVGMLFVMTFSFKDAYHISQAIYPLTHTAPTFVAFGIILLIFRYFDITKPLFIRHIDRTMQNSFSVLLDDLVAAAFAVGVLKTIGLVLERIT
jgi:phosphatidylglycerophosphatase A